MIKDTSVYLTINILFIYLYNITIQTCDNYEYSLRMIQSFTMVSTHYLHPTSYWIHILHLYTYSMIYIVNIKLSNSIIL